MKAARTDYFANLSVARRYLASLDCAVYVNNLGSPVYSHEKPVSVSATVGGREYLVTRNDEGKISQKFTGYAS